MVSLLGLSSRIIFPLLIFAVFPQVLEKNGGDNETRTCDCAVTVWQYLVSQWIWSQT